MKDGPINAVKEESVHQPSIVAAGRAASENTIAVQSEMRSSMPMPFELPEAGRTLARMVEDVPLNDRHWVLDEVERLFRVRGDLPVLREIKGYRALAAQTLLDPKS